MTSTLIQPTRFSVPTITERPGRLLDIANIITSDIKWLPREGLFETFNCITTTNVAVIPCPVATLVAPTQTASSTATTGGTLAAGTYRAYVTAINSRGETVVSNEQAQVTTGATSTVTLNWGAVTGATGYRIYVTSGATTTEKFLIQVGAVTTYTWTGTPAVGTGAYPTLNTAVVNVTKTFSNSGFQDGIQFAAYAGHVCKGIGYEDASLDELQRVFEFNESQAIERALMQQRFTVNGTVWAAATDLTPAGGAVTAQQGLALLEGHASWNYAGVPTIHAPRSVGSLLTQGGSVFRVGQGLQSVLGAKVAAGAGYEQPNTGPAGTAPAAGEKWMYASGEVAVVRSAIERHNEMNRDTNEIFSLVERMYVAAVDCYTAAVRVKVV